MVVDDKHMYPVHGRFSLHRCQGAGRARRVVVNPEMEPDGRAPADRARDVQPALGEVRSFPDPRQSGARAMERARECGIEPRPVVPDLQRQAIRLTPQRDLGRGVDTGVLVDVLNGLLHDPEHG